MSVFRKFLPASALIFAAVLIGGCSTPNSEPARLDINSDVPTAVVEKLPLRVAVVFNPTFVNYSTLESPTDGKPWNIGLGNTHRKIFRNIFASMFDNIREYPDIKATGNSKSEYDVIFEATVDDYSLLTASESGGNFYAVSMRHYINIYNPDLEHKLRLEVNSYGRTVKKALAARQSIDKATDDAFRDLSVTLYVELPKKLADLGFISSDTR